MTCEVQNVTAAQRLVLFGIFFKVPTIYNASRGTTSHPPMFSKLLVSMATCEKLQLETT